jgi:IS1 family transposase
VNQLPLELRKYILRAAVEGVGIRQTSRIFNVDKNTTMWLVADVGRACLSYHDKYVRAFGCSEIQCDEMHGFVHTRDENLDSGDKSRRGKGSFYTWIALDPITKFAPSWHVGRRTAADAERFITDLAHRVCGRIQLSTDGFKAYLPAVEKAFGADDVDYGQLLKIFSKALHKMSVKDWLETGRHGARHPALEAIRKVPMLGDPALDRIATAHIERFNLTVRMSLRRYTRDTNAFSKTIENHRLYTAAFQFFYNFARPHRSLVERRKGGAVIQRSPAMAAGLADRIWTTEDILSLLR